LEELQTQAETLRGLEPNRPLTLVPVTAVGMVEVMNSTLRQGYSQERARIDASVLAALGLIEPSFDLWGFYLELVEERQLHSFYDHEGDTLYVVAGEQMTATDRLTYIHQYALALLDGEYDLDEGLAISRESCHGIDDRCTAARALAEGDASILEEQWLRLYASDEDIDDVIGLYAAYESPAFARASDYLQSLFLFPFREGAEFVRWHQRPGGWAAIDELYERSPGSTEAILHPSRPFEDGPVLLEFPEVDPSGGWAEISRGRLGEFGFRQVLAQQLEDDSSLVAAAGWGGDLLIAYGNGDEIILVVVQIWDTIRDSQEAYLEWRDYGDLRFGAHDSTSDGYEWGTESTFVLLERASNQTLWLLAPDGDAAQTLRQSLTFPAPKQR
jgi:hypothetical protein